MRIGLISGEFPPMPGGVGDFTRSLAEKLREHGQEVHILSRAGSSGEFLNVSSVRGWGAWRLPAIRGWARRHNLDLINLQYQTAAYDMSPFIHFLPAVVGLPLVTTFHDLRYPYLFPKAGRLRDWIVMRLARKSAGVICTNHEDDRRLARLPNRRLIPIGSSIPKASRGSCQSSAPLKPAGTNANAFVIGHFGFINALKGLDDLIDAIAKLRADGLDLRLVFIGGRRNAVESAADAAYHSELEEHIERLGLADAVTWTGYLPDHEVGAWLRAVDLVALPYIDGASYRRSSLMAAIHSGCAILTTAPAVAVDAFAHGLNLWLVTPASVDALENGIRTLMREREQLHRLRAGAAKLSARFDWDAIALDTIDFFQSLV